MAAKKKPAGNRVVVYWRQKSKARIEGLSVSEGPIYRHLIELRVA
jgi:hypothetical protein